MKLVGFVKEYNNLPEGKSLSEFLNSKSMEATDTEKILNYLNQGVLLLAWMGYFVDIETKELIAPDSYFTDGIWVWPSYFPYYIKKYPTVEFDKEFVKYIKDKGFNFSIERDFESKKNILEKELSAKLNG